MRKQLSAILLVSTSLLLLGCGAAAPEEIPPASGAENADGTTDANEPEAPTDAGAALSIDGIGSCDDLEAHVTEYIEGLVPAQGNTVDEWGVNCMWTMADDETDWANAREVSVSIVPLEEGMPAPDLSMFATMEGAEILEDPWLGENDGIAYSLRISTGTVGATSTFVWTPSFEVTVGGGNWEGYPSLDGTAALELAKRVLS